MRLNFAIKLFMVFSMLECLLSDSVTITGVVKSKNDSTSIAGADIYIEKYSIGTVSNQDGKFILKSVPKEEIQFKFSIIGYKDIVRAYKLDDEFNDLGTIFLSVDTIKSKEILVESERALEQKDFASNRRLSGGRYQENLKASLAETLQRETGLSTRSMGQGAIQPVLRGYYGDRFLLTDDGITVGDLSNTSIDHAVSMDMASYNKVEIIRGPKALLYGSNTIGGIIDVSRFADQTARYKKNQIKGIFGSESSNTGLFGNVIAYLPIHKNHQFRISFLNRKTGDQITPIGVLNNTALTNKELATCYTYFGKRSRTIFCYETIDLDYGIPGSPEGHIDGVEIKMGKTTQRANYSRNISILGFEEVEIDQRSIIYGHGEYVTGYSFASVEMDHEIFSLQGKLKSNRSTFGTLYQRREFDAGGFYWTPDCLERRFAIFGLIEQSIGKMNLQLSSRIEHLSIKPVSISYLSNLDAAQISNRNFPLLSTGVSISRPWEKNWTLSTAAMYTSRSPGVEDLYSDGPHLGVYSYEIGNPNLDTERTIGIETVLDYSSKKTDITMVAYRNYSPSFHISSKMGDGFVPGADYIEWGSGSSGWLYKYEMRPKEALIYGFESDFEYRLSTWIHLFGSLSINRGDDLKLEIPLQYMPPDKLLFTAEFIGKEGNLSTTIIKVQEQKRLGEYETRTNGYFTANLSGSYSFYTFQLAHKIILKCENIFDEEFYNHLSRVKSIMPESGRNVSVQYQVLF